MEAESAGRRFALLGWALDERLRRLFSATEAKELGRGGVTAVAAATGVSRRAIQVGLKELAPPSTSRAMRSTAGTTRSVRGRRIRDLYLRPLPTGSTWLVSLAGYPANVGRPRQHCGHSARGRDSPLTYYARRERHGSTHFSTTAESER